MAEAATTPKPLDSPPKDAYHLPSASALAAGSAASIPRKVSADLLTPYLDWPARVLRDSGGEAGAQGVLGCGGAGGIR